MAATCGSICSCRFSPQTRTRSWSDGLAGMSFPSTWDGRRPPTHVMWLLHGATGSAGGNVFLSDNEQDDGRDGGKHGGCHHRAPVRDVGAKVGVNAQRDRCDVSLRGQSQRKDEVAPREQEGEQ